MRKIPFFIDILATGFYTGKAPFMPGTFGSLAAIPLGWAGSFLCPWGKILLFASVFFAGVFVSQRYAALSGIKDPSQVVIDEIAGLLLLYLLFPFKPLYIVSGFVFFRIFDILKPFPVNYMETFPGGWGIMLDDIMAAIYASLSLWALKMIIERF